MTTWALNLCALCTQPLFYTDALKWQGKQTHHITFACPNWCWNYTIIITCSRFSHKKYPSFLFLPFLSITIVVSYLLVKLCDWASSFAPLLQMCLSFFHVCHLGSDTIQTPKRPPGELSVVFPVGQLSSEHIFIFPFYPSRNPLQGQHGWCPHQCWKLFVFGSSTVIWIEYLHTVFSKIMYTYDIIRKQTQRPIQI